MKILLTTYFFRQILIVGPCRGNLCSRRSPVPFRRELVALVPLPVFTFLGKERQNLVASLQDPKPPSNSLVTFC